jgi:hypothetical protein
MRPDFGAGLREFVFESIDATTIHRVQTRVRALVDWEPRIDIVDVEVMKDPVRRNALLIQITYRVRASNSLTNLVYPFYLGEGEKWGEKPEMRPVEHCPDDRSAGRGRDLEELLALLPAWTPELTPTAATRCGRCNRSCRATCRR